MPIIDETVDVIRDDEWQYVRVPLSVQLPGGELRLLRSSPEGPITLSEVRTEATFQRGTQDLEKFFHLLDEAHAAGETFDLKRDFCPPRDVPLS